MTKNAKIITTVLVLVALGGFGWAALNAPDNRTFGEKIEDAGNKLDEGVDDAARELQNNTPLERLEDGYKDATDGDAN